MMYAYLNDMNGRPRTDSDKSGSSCIVFDACIHEDPMEKSIEDVDFKYFLITLALEWVEAKHNLSLSRGKGGHL